MCVCVCLYVCTIVIGLSAHFSGWWEAVREKLDPVTAFGRGPSTVDSSELEEAPPFHCCSRATLLSVRPAPCTGPADFNYTLSAEFTGGFPGRRRYLSARPPAAHFLSGLAGPRWNRSLCLLLSLHNLVLEVDLSPLEIRRIKAAFKSRSGY